jgi:hypothetical protein
MAITGSQVVQLPDGSVDAAGSPRDGYRDIGAADWTERETADGWTFERADMVGLETIDVPTPCPQCRGIVFWFDVFGGAHCEVCCPPRPRVEQQQHRAAQFPRLQPVARTREFESSAATVPQDIIADPIPICSDCQKRPVVRGQPGRPAGLCFDCWTLEQARMAMADHSEAVPTPMSLGKRLERGGSRVRRPRGPQRRPRASRRAVVSATP